MDSQDLQKQIFKKISDIIRLSDKISKEISERILSKSDLLNVELTQDLKEKCAQSLSDPASRTQYECKVCGKIFDDGRKLGGHVSRAHKTPDKM